MPGSAGTGMLPGPLHKRQKALCFANCLSFCTATTGRGVQPTARSQQASSAPARELRHASVTALVAFVAVKGAGGHVERTRPLPVAAVAEKTGERWLVQAFG
jgi:hypothetical protein